MKWETVWFLNLEVFNYDLLYLECMLLVEHVVVGLLDGLDSDAVVGELEEDVTLGLALGVNGVVLVHHFADLERRSYYCISICYHASSIRRLNAMTIEKTFES